ncbi:hypothetical protein CLV98_10871 [Dyadobacter jejuensis]|uniref:Uncharacterized protein n=1 Tax=Dyadobacter jejuensis TaxID=1082580 RepID=A0A316AHN6_9BACT|nr:hypothetical protein [Dyadobacter jejuensis]PWJ57151.1 hypothetical protein CLV98_10871 [Dyadobacter jejuensis]
MKKSNIFAFIELSKLVAELKSIQQPQELKEKLKSQSAYFNILESRYFSDPLVAEWQEILKLVKRNEAVVDQQGRVVVNAVTNSLDHLSLQECEGLSKQIVAIFEKVRQEFQ